MNNQRVITNERIIRTSPNANVSTIPDKTNSGQNIVSNGVDMNMDERASSKIIEGLHQQWTNENSEVMHNRSYEDQ